MDLVKVAFMKLMKEGKASIFMGMPVYDFNELLDSLIEVRDFYIKQERSFKESL